MSREQPRLRKAIEIVRTDLSLYMWLSATSDESGKVTDEQVVELAFVVGNPQQVDMLLPIAVLPSVEWKDFVVSKTKTLTLMDGFMFSNLGLSENLRGNCRPSMTSSLK